MEQLLLLTAEAANQDCIQEEKTKEKTSIFELQSIGCENINILNFTVVLYFLKQVNRSTQLLRFFF